jgi:hypothetical protein
MMFKKLQPIWLQTLYYIEIAQYRQQSYQKTVYTELFYFILLYT